MQPSFDTYGTPTFGIGEKNVATEMRTSPSVGGNRQTHSSVDKNNLGYREKINWAEIRPPSLLPSYTLNGVDKHI